MSSEGKIEDLNELLKGFGNIERVAVEFDFLPTAEEMLLKVIAKLNPYVKAEAVYEGRVVTTSNIDKLGKKWRNRMPEWHNQLKQLHCKEGLYRYCELLAKIVGQLLGYSKSLSVSNRVIVSAIREGYIRQPIPIDRIKADSAIIAQKLADVAIDWLKQLSILEGDPSDTIGPSVKPKVKPPIPPKPMVPPPRPKIPPPPPPKPKIPPPRPKMPPPPPPKPKVSPEPSQVPSVEPKSNLWAKFIAQVEGRSDDPTKTSATGEHIEEPGAGPRGASFTESQQMPIQMGKTRVPPPNHSDVTRFLVEAIEQDKVDKEAEQKSKLKFLFRDTSIQFRFLPDCYEILRSCCDWEYVMPGTVVGVSDYKKVAKEWRGDKARDLKHLITEKGLEKYAVRLHHLLDAIKNMLEPHTITNAIYLMQEEGILKRSPEMVADMLAMDHQQILYITRGAIVGAGLGPAGSTGIQGTPSKRT